MSFQEAFVYACKNVSSIMWKVLYQKRVYVFGDLLLGQGFKSVNYVLNRFERFGCNVLEAFFLD